MVGFLGLAGFSLLTFTGVVCLSRYSLTMLASASSPASETAQEQYCLKKFEITQDAYQLAFGQSQQN